MKNLDEHRERSKEIAVGLMEKLNIYKPYIRGFKAKATKVCYFERFGGFWAYQNEELTKKIKEVEEKYDCVVYAVTHEYTEFGELYDMLIVPNERDWNPACTKIEAQIHFMYMLTLGMLLMTSAVNLVTSRFAVSVEEYNASVDALYIKLEEI